MNSDNWGVWGLYIHCLLGGMMNCLLELQPCRTLLKKRPATCSPVGVGALSWIVELLIGNDSSFEGTLNGDMMREGIWDDVSMWIKLDLFRLSIATTEPRKEMIDPGCSVTVHIRRSCGLVPGRQ